MFIKKVISISILILIICSCQKKPASYSADNYLIKGDITALGNNTKVVLKKQENGDTVSIDSTLSENGTFEFSGAIKTPSMYGIFIDSIKGGIYPLVESGTISISAHKDSLYNAHVRGTKLNDELNIFKEGSKKIVDQINDLFPEFQKARAGNDAEKIDLINAEMKAINDENTAYSLNYTKNKPDSYISALILQSLLRMPDMNPDKAKAIFNNFSEDVKKSDFSKNIKKYIEQDMVQKDSIK
jgi:hypothetical protein